MIPNRTYQKITEDNQRRFPLIFKSAYPASIVVPKDYTDPVYYAPILIGNCRCVLNPAMQETAHKTAYKVSLALMSNRVPTYFVADEFAFAVANTTLPGDFKFAELKWPFPAQLFVFSDAFTENYYGCAAPFLSIARMTPGIYPAALRKFKTEIQLRGMELNEDHLIMDFPFIGSEVPVDYNAAYPMSSGIEAFKTMPWNDATLFEQAFRRHSLTPKGGLEKEEEQEFIEKAQQLAVKILLSVANMPTQVEHGKVTRHAVVTQQGKVKLPELVSPNVIGRTYRIKRQVSPVEGSSVNRAAPRFKYRRGHYAWAAKRTKNIEFVSVEAMPRKPEGYIDFDAAGEVLSQKFRACHERVWIEGFFFSDSTEEK